MSILLPEQRPNLVTRVWSWVLYQVEEMFMVGCDGIIGLYLAVEWIINQIRKA